MANSRKVHCLDDESNPTGPVMCGKTSVEVLGEKLSKGDVVCSKCVVVLMARANEYADSVNLLRELVIEERAMVVELETDLASKDRVLLKVLMEREERR